MNDVLALSSLEQASLIRHRRISVRELVQAHLDRLSAINPILHAVTDVLATQAIAQAAAADDALATGGSPGCLAGVPFTVKDSIEVAGAVCTAGTLGRAHAPVSTRDATLVSRLRKAGAIPIAKTNLPDLLFAFESDNLIHGATNNPYDLSRTAGGSSGGEAAVIAASGSPMGLGSDAAGSVRLPAAFCGIAGIKPTSGRLSRTGHLPPAGGWIEALWQIGPMARRVRDLWSMLQQLTGSDDCDPTVVSMPLRNWTDVNLHELRAAFYTDNGVAPTSTDVRSVVHDAVRSLAGEVREIHEDRPPGVERAYDLEMGLLGLDGGDAVLRYAEQSGSTRTHPLLAAWIDKLKPYRTGIDGCHRFWSELDRYRAEMFAFLRNYDVIVCPVYTQVALLHGTSILDENFRGFSHTMTYNLTGWPAAVVRCGTSETGLPIGVQIVSRPWREDVALAVAQRLEYAFGGWQAPSITVRDAPASER